MCEDHICHNRIVRLPPCGGSGLKFHGDVPVINLLESPSVWREWIEMTTVTKTNS